MGQRRTQAHWSLGQLAYLIVSVAEKSQGKLEFSDFSADIGCETCDDRVVPRSGSNKTEHPDETGWRHLRVVPNRPQKARFLVVSEPEPYGATGN